MEKNIFKGKKILILGANPEVISLVERARELGCYTIVTDYNPKALSKKFCDYPLDIDASDVDALESFARSERVDGVMLGVAEAISKSYVKLCARLEKPCFATNELLDLLTDKARFKDVCRSYDVPVVPEFDLREDLSHIVYPVVVKPVDGCSSKGISVCRNEQELRSGVEKALSFSQKKQVLVEKYMTSGEVVIYYAFQDGEPTFLSMCDRYTNKEQEGVAQLPTAYVFPSRFERNYREKIDENVKKMFRGIGIKNGVMFIQSFVSTDGSVCFYEPGFRLNGAQEHMLFSRVLGIDAKEMLIRFALTGSVADFSISRKWHPFDKAGCKFSPLVRECELGSINSRDELMRLPGVVAVQPSYRQGDIVVGRGTLKQILTRVYILEDNYDQLFDSLEAVYSAMRATDKEGAPVFLDFTDVNVLRGIYK